MERHIPTYEQFVNESNSDSAAYWKSYEKDHPMQDHPGEKKETNIKRIDQLIDDQIEYWTENAEEPTIFGDFSRMRIKGEAYRFFSSFHYINENIVDAMIMQLGDQH